ncbi:diguanylate cyclase (plasmid) [Tistrella bauzanensis]|uniref:Diguanylate cyclase DosC n=1 Tax=Tistrella arctica TaxID=3133430 RepID=A0ABU9YRD3_9PROT
MPTPGVTGTPAGDRDGPSAAAGRDWRRAQAALDDDLRLHLAELVADAADDLAGDFYRVLLADPEAAPLLSHDLVRTRLRASLAGWLCRLFANAPLPDFDTMAAGQRHIGEVHARVRVPIHLVGRGARLIKAGLAGRLAASLDDRDRLVQALIHIETVMDIAIELMNTAFVSDLKRETRNEEAYRLFFLSQDLTLERESQRAALLEWNQTVLLALAGGAHVAGAATGTTLPAIGRSEFGLWFHHRGSIMFEGLPVLDQVARLMQAIDGRVLPDIDGARATGGDIAAGLGALQGAVGEIRFVLKQAFEGLIGIEAGRDALTRTLNRRFLPAILNREIALALRRKRPFALIMIDLDHFKAINDAHGHSAGDAALRRAAETILGTCRGSDIVFRYGGEEFLVVAVETDDAAAREMAERLRAAIAATDITLASGAHIVITASIGIAVFDGHPDYGRLIDAADRAMYDAKHGGRDRVVSAPTSLTCPEPAPATTGSAARSPGPVPAQGAT